MTIPEEFLFMISEIAIALIGFSGVVTVLGHRGKGEWTSAELLQLRTQVEPSAVTLFGAMFPIILGLVIEDQETLWRSCNALLAAFMAIAFIAYLLRIRNAPTVLSQKIMTVISAFVMLGLIASALSLIDQIQFTFALGLVLGIVVGVHNFALLLFRVEEAA